MKIFQMLRMNLVFALILPMAAAFGADGSISYESTTSGGSTTTRVSIPTRAGDASVFQAGQIFATGPAARNLSQGYAAKAYYEGLSRARIDQEPKAPPKRPERATIPILSSQGKPQCALYELFPGSRIFIGSRHCLQERQAHSLGDSFAAAHIQAEQGRPELQLKDYSFYAARDKSTDVVIAVPTSRYKESEVFTLPVPGLDTCACSRQSLPLRLREFNQFETRIRVDTPYVSDQYGTIDGGVGLQVSRGKIVAVRDGEFYLGIDPGNRTNGGSSGALALVGNDSKVGGIIQCFLPAGNDESGRPEQPSFRVISASRLLSSDFDRISPKRLASEKKHKDSRCIPTDGRSAGGP